MGTYTILRLKNKSEKNIKKVNDLLKNYGAKYETFEGVEFGYFRTLAMTLEDCRYMNEDPEGLKQATQQARPIKPEYIEDFFWNERGTYSVKISSLNDDERNEINIISKWLNDGGKEFLNLSTSENLYRLLEERTANV